MSQYKMESFYNTETKKHRVLDAEKIVQHRKKTMLQYKQENTPQCRREFSNTYQMIFTFDAT